MISVIIPTFNEAEHLPSLLARLGHERPVCQIVVSDGGSCDSTCDLAREHGAQVVISPPGRGQQLRRGAGEAQGNVFLFLHADCLFPQGGIAAIENALGRDNSLIGGNFRLVFDGNDTFSRWLDGFYAWIRVHGLYYGDSGIFVRRSVYEALGGFKSIAVMEDYDFVRCLERLGPTCCIGEPPLVTSSRRFASHRPFGIVLGWLVMHGLYHLGVAPDVLALLYDSARRRQAPRRMRDQGADASFKAQS